MKILLYNSSSNSHKEKFNNNSQFPNSLKCSYSNRGLKMFK